MTIGVDASLAVRSVRAGRENYSREVIRRLVNLDRRTNFILYAPHPPKDDYQIPNWAKWRFLPEKRPWTQVRLARELNKTPPDILFVPTQFMPILSRVPTVVTIDDLAYRSFPELYTRWQRRYLALFTSIAVGKARRLIVPSQHIKTDLLNTFQRLNSDQIEVIAPGYNQEIFCPNDSDPPPVAKPYILYVGRLEEHKNSQLLVEAFALLAREYPEIKLVLAGSSGSGYSAIERTIKQLPQIISRRVILPGYLPRYDMIRYLQHAAVFAFPSRYEGFGLAVLEAMACGVAVVCSNTSSLPEITGQSAITLPPENPDHWARGMRKILEEPATAAKMKAAALKRAATYSWDRSAKKILEVLLDAIK